MALHRTQILLEANQHRGLADMAAREGRSVSEVVRNLVQRELDAQSASLEARIQKRLEVLARIDKHKQEYLASGGKPISVDYWVKVINEDRDERGAEIWRNATRGRGRRRKSVHLENRPGSPKGPDSAV